MSAAWPGSGAGHRADWAAGWGRIARAVAEAFPPEEITGIWLFAPLTRAEREWGTAVVARRGDDGRTRVYTARYMTMLRGRERGQGRVAVEEVGVGPDAVMADVLRGVQERAGEAHPPTEVPRSRWYGAEDDESHPRG